MTDYLSRLVEYSLALKEIEIAGEEHLKAILQNPSEYLKKAERIRGEISSDQFLAAEDRERMLKKVNGYVQQVRAEKDEINLQSFLLGALLFYFLRDENVFSAFVEELTKILG